MFCGNDPVNYADPSGLCEKGESTGIWNSIKSAVSDLVEKITQYQKACEIADEVHGKFAGQDNMTDAMRHAEWNRRMAAEIGQFRAFAYGTGHEIDNYFSDGDEVYAGRMDLRNNAAGRRAAREGRGGVPESWLFAIRDAPPGQQLEHIHVVVPIPFFDDIIFVRIPTPW